MVRGRDHLNKPSEKVSSVKHWTDDEIAILKEKYPTEGRNVQKWLPGRKLGDIQQKARYLQVRVEGKENFYWTAAEKETLLVYYPSEGPDVCRRLPDRTSSACTSMYWKLVSGKKKEPVRRRWTEAEVNILKKYYPTEGKDVALRLPGWSQKKCMEKALLLGMKKPGKKQPRGLSEIFAVAEELKETPVKGICIV